MGEAGRAVIAVITAIIGLAALSVILSNQANTSNIITSSGTALQNVIGAAVAPVTGGGGSL